MLSHYEGQRIPVSLLQGAIHVPLQGMPDLQMLLQMRADMAALAAQKRCNRAWIDLSGIQSLDLDEYENLIATGRMLSMLGVRMVFVGMRPGLIAGLAAAGADLTAFPGACDLDQAMHIR